MKRQISTSKAHSSRRLVAGVAGLGLVVALAGGTSVSAAGSSPIARLAQALTTLTSYRLDLTVSTNKASASRLRLDVVRTGTSTSAHLTGSEGGQQIDAVISGSKVCFKAGGALYQCTSNPQLAASFNQDPSAALVRASKTTTYSSAPSKTIGGVSCDGYTFKGVQSGFAINGTLYIQHSSGLPCEDDEIETRKVASVSTNDKVVAVWSHLNDKSLTIPTVK